MTQEMEFMLSSFHRNEVPIDWTDQRGLGYSSIKPLNSWLQDLYNRVEFFRDWEISGTPKVFLISAFYFPQSFISAIKQN